MTSVLIGLLVFVGIWGVCSTVMMYSNYYPFYPAMQMRVYGRILSDQEYLQAMRMFDFMKKTPIAIFMLFSLLKYKFSNNAA